MLPKPLSLMGSLVARSEARYVVPPKSFFKESAHNESQVIPALAKMLQSVLGSILDLKTKQQSSVEHYNGFLQMDMIDCRNRVIIQFQNSPALEISISVGEHPLRIIPMCTSSRDREYWQRALLDLSKDHPSPGSNSQSSTVHSTRGRIKFLLGEFESALLDLDRALLDSHRALNSNTDGLASTLLDLAMVKCALARYPEASQDIKKAAEINPNWKDIERFRTCLEDILCMDSSKSSTPTSQPMQPVFDLLTGDPDGSRSHERNCGFHRLLKPEVDELREPWKRRDLDLPPLSDRTECMHGVVEGCAIDARRTGLR